MKNKETFLWYDLETFGTNPRFDRISQFAAIRTDKDLNIIEEPIIEYCKLSLDYLPSIESCFVTGITPDIVNEKGINEAELASLIYNEFTRSNTCIAGFNSSNFDDEFIRNLFYRNFYDPYEWSYKNGNSRFDLLNLVRGAFDFRRKSFTWPERNVENNNPVFKLTELTKANKISHEMAHDALDDVRATIAVAKLIKDKEPKIFDYALRLRSKQFCKEIATKDNFLYTNAYFTSNAGCTRMVKSLHSTNRIDSNVIYYFDLSLDPTPLIKATPDDILSTPGLNKLKINKGVFVAPIVILKRYGNLAIDKKLCIKHSKMIDNSNVKNNLLIAANNVEESAVIDDVDFKIYNGENTFFSYSDKAKFPLIRECSPYLLLKTKWDVSDKRFNELLFRYTCRNYFSKQDDKTKSDFISFAKNRIVTFILNNLTSFNTEIRLKEADKDLDARGLQIIKDLKDYAKYLSEELGII